jgi:hypothetical protein
VVAFEPVAAIAAIRGTGFMECRPVSACHSALMLASLMTRAHLSDSAFRKAVSSAGVAFDDDGFPIQVDGTSTVIPGLYFVGVHFLRKAASVGGKLEGAMTAYQSSAS